MKIFYLLFSFLFILSGLQAQITITSDDMPQANDTFLVSNSFILFFDADATGADYDWDYSDLNSFSQDSVSYIAMSDAAFIFQLIFNSPFNPSNQATEGKRITDLSLVPGVDISDAYLFTKNSSSKIEELGFGVTFSEIPLPIQYTDNKTLYEFPLDYGDSIGDDYAFNVAIPNLAYLGEYGNRSYEVDGWGSLTTSFGTFDVLRTKVNMSYADTIYIDSSEFGMTIPRNITIYEWLGEETGIPLLQITTEFGIVTSVVYQDYLQIPTAIVEIEEDVNGFSIYPQPAQDFVTIKLDKIPNTTIQVHIYDLSGKEVMQENFKAQKELRLSTTDLTSGLYMIEVKMASFNKVQKLIIR